MNNEETLLGQILTDNTIYHSLEITDVDLQKLESKRIFQGIKKCIDSGLIADIVTVIDANNNISPSYLASLTSNVASAANWKYYHDEIVKNSYKQKIIKLSSQLQDWIKSMSPDETVRNIEDALMEITKKTGKNRVLKINEIAHKFIETIEERYKDHGRPLGIQTGIESLDEMIIGFRKRLYYLIGGRPSQGKCFSKGTEIRLFNGKTRKVEDIKAGDLLMGVDNKPRKVLNTSTDIDEMYEIKQLYGKNYIVNSEHVLSLKRCKNEGNKLHGEVKNISINDLLEKGPSFFNRWKGYRVPVDYKYEEVPIEPYFLGVWLGDASSNVQRIHNPEKEIEAYLRSYAKRLGYKLSVANDGDKRCNVLNIVGTKGSPNNLYYALKKMNLINNKHIPEMYMINKRSIRNEILAGLLDIDGHHQGNGSYEFTQKNKYLFDQVKDLANSLGYRATESKNRIINGETYKRGIISGEGIPCKVKRKCFDGIKSRDVTMTKISITPIGIGRYYGFEIDQDNLFLLKDYTVTHNSALLLNFACHAGIRLDKIVGYISTESSVMEIVTRLFASEGKVNSMNLITGFLTPHTFPKMIDVAERVYDKHMYFYYTPGMTLDNVAQTARLMVRYYGCEIIFVDYLQDISVESKETSIEKTARKSKTMKYLAEELNIPIVAGAQLRRDAEERRPRLSDFSDSSQLEKDVDGAILIYHHHINKKETEEIPEYRSFLLAEKVRDGITGQVPVQFTKEYVTFNQRIGDE